MAGPPPVEATAASETVHARNLLIPLLLDPPDLSAVSNPETWAAVKAAAGRDGVAQLVAFVARPHVSVEERAWCDKVLRNSWIRHERSLADLDYVLGILGEAGIPALSLKGPVLARRHYKPPFLRKPSFDLDVAVALRDLGQACEVLGKAGYALSGSLADAVAHSHHAVLTHSTRLKVELHFRLTHAALGIRTEELFARALPFRLPRGRETLVLSASDELLHLALHLAHARFDNLFHAYETRQLWRTAAPHAREEAERLAADCHFSGVLALVDVGFAVRWGEPLLPRGMLQKTWLHSRIGKDLFEAFERSAPSGTRHTIGSRLRAKWLEIQITDRPLDALRFAGMVGAVAWSQMLQGGWRPVSKRSQLRLD